MVLQRDTEIHLWGWAEAGERITVKFVKQKESVTTDASGCWEVRLAPVAVGGPFSMTIEGNNTIELENILMGDVWVCSGQSNMGWMVKNSNNSEEEIARAHIPEIRLFTVPHRMATQPLDTLEEGSWQRCTPETIPDFSAVAYFFGRELTRHLNVPIGLIHSSWGGTRAESWISPAAIGEHRGDPNFTTEFTNLDLETALDEGEQRLEQWQASLKDYDAGLQNNPSWYAPETSVTDWSSIQVPGDWRNHGYPSLVGTAWYRTQFTLPAGEDLRDVALHLGTIDDSDQVWVNGTLVGETRNDRYATRVYEIPASALRSGPNVLAVRVENYGTRGGLWSPADSLYVATKQAHIPLAGSWRFKVGNQNLPEHPGTPGPNLLPSVLFQGMIHPLLHYPIKGVIWYQGEANASEAGAYRRLFSSLIRDWRDQWEVGTFPFLLVQLANFRPPTEAPQPSDWAELREAQAAALALENTGMAVAIDVGEADDIHPRDKQTVGHRLALAARGVAYGESIEYSGPVYDEMEVEDNSIRIYFEHADAGVKTPRGEPIKGFAIAGEDQQFVWADATVEGNTVVVSSDKVPQPVAVRYAWSDNPDRANLYNEEGLPAVPFRTDQWKRPGK